MADYQGRRLRPKKEAESFQIRVLNTFESPSGHIIGRGSVLYYPKIVALNMVNCGWGERVYGLPSQIL